MCQKWCSLMMASSQSQYPTSKDYNIFNLETEKNHIIYFFTFGNKYFRKTKGTNEKNPREPIKRNLIQ